MKKILISIVFILSVFICNSQDFTADRPGIGSSADVIPAHRFQIETGCYSDGEISYNNSLLRYSFVENGEIRLSSNFVKNSGVTGFQPFTVGIKIKLFENKSIRPSMAFISQLQLPFLAKSDFKTHIVSPAYYFLFSNNITDNISIGYNIGIESHEIFDGKFFEYSLNFTPMGSLSLNCDLGKGYGTFFEVYNNYSNNTSFDFGFTKLIRDRLQFDISYIQGNKSINCGLVYLF